MKPILSIILLLIFSLIITETFAQEEVTVINHLEKEINNKEIVKILTKNIASFPEKTQISIALINGESTIYIGVIRDNNTLKIINNKNSLFEIGSITKVFTSVLFSSFIYQKKITLNETLQAQFNFTLKNGGNITLQQLANHTSGLPRLPTNIFTLFTETPNNPYVNYTPKMLEEYLKNDIELEYPKGTKSAYSNLGAGMLGYILTKKAKKTYEELLQETIFTPLQMTNSTTFLNNDNLKKLIKGRNQKGEKTSNWDFTDALVGAGGIKSTVIDMEKFIRKNFEKTPIFLLPQKTTYTVNKKHKMGLGWHILKNDTILFHNGATGGYRSSLTLKVAEKKAVIILSNISAFHNKSNAIDTLCFQLLKTL